jgi:hypothetical protein
MSKQITLVAGQLTGAETLTVELVEAGENSVVIVKWPAKRTITHQPTTTTSPPSQHGS